MLGGLGSRQRKGLGSVSITELKTGNNIVPLPENRKQFIDRLHKLINKSAIPEPPFTAFSSSTKILCSPSNSASAWKRLEEISKSMQLFRGWGFQRNGDIHRINRVAADHAAYSTKTSDHISVYQYLDRRAVYKLPHSIVFGLPRSYNLSQPNRQELKLEPLAQTPNHATDNDNKRSRRASPLFIHIHQFPNNESMIIQSFLPATFLPLQDTVQVKRKIGDDWRVIGNIAAEHTPDWQVIEDYLQTFNDWQAV